MKKLLLIILIMGCEDMGVKYNTCVKIQEYEYNGEIHQIIYCIKNMPESQCLPYYTMSGEILDSFIVEWYNDITCEEYCEQAEDGCQVEFDWDAYCDANPDRPDCD